MKPHKTPDWILKTKKLNHTRERNQTIAVAFALFLLALAIVALVAQ